MRMPFRKRSEHYSLPPIVNTDNNDNLPSDRREHSCQLAGDSMLIIYLQHRSYTSERVE
jgi:hypothetical protein